MKAQLIELFKDSTIYGLSGIVSSLISIFLIPLYTRIFQPADYGIISILTTTGAFLNILLIFSLDNSAAIYFWDKSDDSERKKTFNSWFWFLALVGLFIAIVVVLGSQLLSLLFFNTKQYYSLFILLGLNVLFVGFQKIFNIWCRMLSQPLKAMIFSTTLLFVTVGFNVVLILDLKVGVIGVMYSQLATSVIGLVFFVLSFRKWIHIKYFSWTRVNEMVWLSAPLVPATLLFWLMNSASVYFMKLYGTGSAEIGLFQVGSSVANVLSLGSWAFFQALTPFVLSVSTQPNARRIYSFIFEGYCVVGFFVAFSLNLLGKDLLKIFTNDNYLEASSVLGLLAINVIILGLPNILAIANSLAKQNKPYAVAMAFGTLASLVLFQLLIPQYGKTGAAYAMMVGNIVVSIYLGNRAQKLYYIPYRFKRIGIVILLMITFFGAAQFVFSTLLGYATAILTIGLLLGMMYYLIGKNSQSPDPQ